MKSLPRDLGCVILSLVAAVALSACSTISNGTNPAADLLAGSGALAKVTATDLLDTAYNLDQAQMIGLLPADSPLPGCAHQINQQLGVEATPGAVAPQTFTPKVGGVASAATESYLLALKAAAPKTQGITLPAICVQAWGTINIQGLSKILSTAGGLPITVK